MKPSSDSIRIMRCQFGNEQYALEMSTVPSVRQLAEVVPSTAGEFPTQLGHLPVAGAEPVPVFSLAERLGRPEPEADGRQHVVVTQTSYGLLGLVVDTVSHVHAVPTSSLISLPSLLNNPSKRVVKNVIEFAGIDGASTGQGSDLSLLLSPQRLHPAAPPVTPSPHQRSAGKADDAEPSTQNTPSQRRGQLVLLSVTDDATDTTPLLGLSVTQIAEVLEPDAVIPVPFSPTDVPGFVVWRKQPVPVVELGKRVGLTGEPANDRLVIARGSDDSELFAFLARTRMRPIRLPVEHQPIDVPTDLNSDSVRAAFTIESSTVLVPNFQSIVCA